MLLAHEYEIIVRATYLPRRKHGRQVVIVAHTYDPGIQEARDNRDNY